MARTWTERRIAAPGTLKADDHNVEQAAVARQVNGAVDQHNVALGSVTSAKLVAGTREFGAHTKSTYLAANSYHRSTLPQAGLTTPNISIDPDDEDLAGGWRSLSPYLDDDGFVAEFTARDGMLHGHTMIDVEMRTSYMKLEDVPDPPVYPSTHHEDYIEIAAFVNGALVADTGPIHPRRLTVDLPWSCPAPAGPCVVETKFRAVVQAHLAAGETVSGGQTISYPPPAVQYPPIQFHGAAIYVRNQYR